MTNLPTRPADLPYDTTLGQLAEQYYRHAGPLVDARHGLGQPRTAEQLAAHAVAALAVQHALAERVLYSRWVNVRDALTYGATPAAVAVAMGLDDDEVRAGLASWADGQAREGLMTDPERDAVLALVRGRSAGAESAMDKIDRPAEGDGPGGSRGWSL